MLYNTFALDHSTTDSIMEIYGKLQLERSRLLAYRKIPMVEVLVYITYDFLQYLSEGGLITCLLGTKDLTGSYNNIIDI